MLLLSSINFFSKITFSKTTMVVLLLLIHCLMLLQLCMHGSRSFRQEGPGPSVIKSCGVFFLSSIYFTEVQWLISNRTIIIQGSRGGPPFPRGGGSNFFQRGWGSNCEFPIETHINCNFPPDPLWIRAYCVCVFCIWSWVCDVVHVSPLVQQSSRRANKKSCLLYGLLTLYSLAFMFVSMLVFVLKFLHLGALW